jgi:hypothetical protein
MSRQMKIFLAILLLAVAAGALYFRVLHERILGLAQPERAERRAVRELAQPAASSTEAKTNAKMFWLSAERPGELEAEEVSLPLSPEPTVRAKQLIEALISSPPEPTQRTLPADAALLEFYLLPDGTAVADFSGAFSSQMPSGIRSEQLAVDSIVRTLEANVPPARRLKILIQGQEVDTLAGHLDLTGFFAVRAGGPSLPAPAKSAASTPSAGLTPQAAPGTLKPQ